MMSIQKLDYEVELGVVIGASVPRYTSKEDVHKYVGGFTVIHDVSARDWQLEKNGGQWLLGKSMDGYAPIGPVIVTTDDFSIEDAHKTGIRCRVNGETLQESNTEQLVFGVDEIVAFVSRFMTLRPGDVIATGTPPGVGCFRNPPRWLMPGDMVECEIDGIGTLTTPIVGPLAKSGLEHTCDNIALSCQQPLCDKSVKYKSNNMYCHRWRNRYRVWNRGTIRHGRCQKGCNRRLGYNIN